MFKHNKLCTGLVLAFGGLTMLPGTVFAQEVTTLQRIEITGSAIKRIDAESSVPVTILKADEMQKQGITSIEQIMSMLTASQTSSGTSQQVGSATEGASFANLRGIGANKTLVLLNGRRIANNAFDSSAPDLNMIPLAALERVEVLRDGASSLYGTDAIGGVINFITKRNYTGGNLTLGADSPQQPGGKSVNANIGFGFGDLDKDGYNVFAFIDYQRQGSVGGLDRPLNKRYPGGLSPTPFPANYYQGGNSGNPLAPTCASSLTIPSAANNDATVTGCQETTSSFVNYTPTTERLSGLFKQTLKINADTQFGLEYFGSKDRSSSVIAPVPYGGLYMNKWTDQVGGQLNPFYPGNPGSAVTPNIPLSETFTQGSPATNPKNADGTPSAGKVAGLLPGFIHVKWRDLYNGQRKDIGINDQQRLLATLDGVAYGWDYQLGAAYNENKVQANLAGYSDGTLIGPAMRDGVLNPFGDQNVAGKALLDSVGLTGNLQNAKGAVSTYDARASRELSDWFGAGRKAAIAIGAEARHEDFSQSANPSFAALVVNSTGIDPNTSNAGTRDVYAGYSELNVPISKELEVTVAARYDKYSDFGSTTNPKIGFRFQPNQEMLFRGSFSTGFRAPSLYDINAGQAYTNGTKQDDPINCPGGVVVNGKSAAANCGQQFTVLTGGNQDLKPEKSKNLTLGAVFEPTKTLSLGIDFWQIQLEQQIGSLSSNTVFQNYQTFASNFHRNPAGDLSTDGTECPNPATCGYVDARTQNLGGLNSNGIDFSANYRMSTNGMGVFNFGLQSTFVNKYEYQDYTGGPWNQNVGVYVGTSPVFKWQHNFNVSWSANDFGAGFAAHYKSDYIDSDPTNTVSAYTTYDAYVSWAPLKTATLVLGVRNLTDVAPPLSYQTDTFQAGYDPRFTDPTGRTIYVRGTYKF